MDKSPIIDLIVYREQHQTRQPPRTDPGSEDLAHAIQNLIRRLRESDPIEQIDP